MVKAHLLGQQPQPSGQDMGQILAVALTDLNHRLESLEQRISILQDLVGGLVNQQMGIATSMKLSQQPCSVKYEDDHLIVEVMTDEMVKGVEEGALKQRGDA